MGKSNKEVIETEVVSDESKKEETIVYEYVADKKVSVKSIANWTTGFQRIETSGDVTIPANGSVRLNASEIISQVQNGNMLFNGVDAQGSHATLFIDDKSTRIEANFETENSEQKVATLEKVKEIFELKQQKQFEKRISETFVTRAEKGFLLKSIKDLKLNDYTKIAFCLDYTGMRLD